MDLLKTGSSLREIGSVPARRPEETTGSKFTVCSPRTLPLASYGSGAQPATNPTSTNCLERGWPNVPRWPGIRAVTLRAVLVASLMILAAPAWATIYYVSRSDGGDNFNGTEQTHTTGSTGPWKTIAKVNAGSFRPGDFILFKRGDTWREQLTVPGSGGAGNPITFGAYGSGARPIISGATLLTSVALKWTLAATGTNEYYAELAAGGDPGLALPNALWVDGHCAVAGTVGALSNHQWAWGPASAGGSFNTVYFRDDSGDPDTTGVTIESGARDRALDVNGRSYVTVDSLDLVQNNSTWTGVLAVRDSTHIIVAKSAVHEGYYANIHVYTTGRDTTEILLENNDISNSHYSSQLVFDGAVGNNVQHNRFSGSTGPNADFIWLTGRSNNNVIQNNALVGPVRNGIYIKAGSSSNVVRYNTMFAMGSTSAAVQIRGDSAACNDNKVYYNVILYAGLAIQTDGDFGSGNDGTVIENNTIYSSGDGENGIHVNHTNTNVTIRNNIVVVGAGDALSVNPSSTAGTTSDHNLMRNNSGAVVVWGASNYTLAQLSSYVSASGQDGASITSDPLFVNAAGGNFQLQAGSPCRDVGVNVDLTRDVLGVPVPQGSAPDIGAYEFAGPKPPTAVIIKS